MSQVTFKRPDGQEASGYYVEPAAGPRAPGVVIIQEWWGVNDQIKGVARRFAERGYRALVPDLYRGQVGLDAKEAQHLMDGLNFGEAAGQDIRGAVQYLKAHEREGWGQRLLHGRRAHAARGSPRARNSTPP